ncbi:MAG: phosphate ABC transporter substrate-binding protein [Halomonas sp.]|uniref:PstS family phosphate ABC transporter substrate-binding protein n=1 Tax=Halomonas sp. TaxID=1486246 RepID=UPI00286FF292|nr:phosphate ABC transporter substrate-binding protein [Halomonas sp.]MDR9437923.1 phosphate ABC transporter substrate-binding protein [Halomonas sp.]
MSAVLRHCLAPWLLVVTLVAPQAQAEQVAGTLGTVGSDTMAGLMLRWGEALTRQHPGIRLQLQASGSASAPPALVAGTTRLGPMSRPMNETERRAFIERHGYPPRELAVARDALVVVVHRHNPLESLGRRELDAIFSDSRRCGVREGVHRWQQLGRDWPEGRIRLHGRNAASGTHGLFRRVALCDGYFRPEINEHPGSAAVVAAVTEDPRAMGYAGLNHLTPGVKALARRDADGTSHFPGPEAVRSGDYALSRDLYLYLNLPPGKPIPAAERAFLDLVLSPAGQAVVEELGFVALPDARRLRQRHELGLDEVGR